MSEETHWIMISAGCNINNGQTSNVTLPCSESPLDPPAASPSEAEQERLSRTSRAITESLLPLLPKTMHLLRHPPAQLYTPMPTTTGLLNPPLGNTRLQIVRLFQTLIQANVESLLDELHTTEFLALVLVTAFLLYQQVPTGSSWHPLDCRTFSSRIRSTHSCTAPSPISYAIWFSLRILRNVPNPSIVPFLRRWAAVIVLYSAVPSWHKLLQLLKDNAFLEKIIDMWEEDKNEEDKWADECIKV